MPNRRVHGLLGVASGVAAYLKLTPQEHRNLPDGCSAATFGYLGGRLPDLVEPADHPNHRQAFHSLVLLCGLCYALYRIAANTQPAQMMIRTALAPGIAGSVSHLGIDAMSAKGLPALGKLGGADGLLE